MCVLVLVVSAVGLVAMSHRIYTIRFTFAHTTGHVVQEHQTAAIGREPAMYSWSAVYRDATGNEHRVSLPGSSSFRAIWTVGEPVAIAYPSADPSKGTLLSTRYDLLGFAIIAFMATFSYVMMRIGIAFRRN